MRNKWWILTAVACTCCACYVGYAQQLNKLWVSKQHTDGDLAVYFVQDLETGTRCYVAQTTTPNEDGHTSNAAPVAISCVPKGGK